MANDVIKDNIEKTIALFQFLKELNKLKQKSILNINEYPWSLSIDAIHNDSENISIYYRDRTEEDSLGSELNNIILSVHKPEFQNCPEPDNAFADWLENGWNSYKMDVIVKDSMTLFSTEQIVYFNDDEERVDSFSKWKELRFEWLKGKK